jgi:hypothetical protein
MSSATYAPLPPTILDDIDHGDLIESEDEKGWVIVMRRRMRNHTFDNGLGKSKEKRPYKSVFVKHGTIEDVNTEVWRSFVKVSETRQVGLTIDVLYRHSLGITSHPLPRSIIWPSYIQYKRPSITTCILLVLAKVLLVLIFVVILRARLLVYSNQKTKNHMAI